MSNEKILQESVQLLAETLRGGPARPIRSLGWWARCSPVGGPSARAALFAPVSPDTQAAADFRERHESAMQAEVLAAVTRVLDRWEHQCEPGCDQSHFDDLFIALIHVRLMLSPRRGATEISPIAERVGTISLAAQQVLTEKWLRPLISAKLNAPGDAPPAEPGLPGSVREALAQYD
ncbi:hypothetical protein JOF56_000542 [Kibdelosporangium banguiense]|uniref:Uncharacterized protein n=1 Tax=Kibdelosporangium banguiense TaxID=1365924 RepID=A0ABS4T6W1_9PSEU|nr:hypothetical protein [Kibdelosporangium banguiense]MBP2320157.1 hypothetical protein [Kibdelosporangium banguiense]